MKTSKLLFSLITTPLLFSSCTINTTQETTKTTEENPSTDIGSVIYTKNPDESGNLIANWVYSANDSTTVVGTGYTVNGSKSADFEGEYKIYYSGASVDSFNLIINRYKSVNDSTFYIVEWQDIVSGNTDYHGTGIVKEDQLIVGWRK